MTESQQLTDEDRALRYQAFQLVLDWRAWTKRRVESISYETATSIRRRVSVDLRLRADLFGEPAVKWGDHYVHYVPVAQLRKGRLVRFDLRDEDDRALPLITKRKNSAIAAGILTAFAQVAIASRLASSASPIEIREPTAIRIPQWLEAEFRLLAQLEPQPAGNMKGSLKLIDTYLAAASGSALVPVEQWGWRLDDERKVDVGMADGEQWRALLASDAAFIDFAFDIARLFFIYAPLRYEPDCRRIVKFSYSEYLGDGHKGVAGAVKSSLVRWGLARVWNSSEDRLEGLKVADADVPDRWSPPLDSPEAPSFRPRRRLFEALGWTTRLGRFETPAVSHGASYHLDISTPEGIQIRRAQLVTVNSEGDPRRHSAERGNRSLRAIDLYTSGTPCRGGNAFLNMRAESSLIIRAAALSSALIATVLTLLWLAASEVTKGHGEHVDAVAATLVIIPGLLIAFSVRDSEHPLATDMVFGLRVLAALPGILSFTAAAEVLFGDPASPFGIALFAAGWLIVAVFLLAWRLASRGRPNPAALL